MEYGVQVYTLIFFRFATSTRRVETIETRQTVTFASFKTKALLLAKVTVCHQKFQFNNCCVSEKVIIKYWY